MEKQGDTVHIFLNTREAADLLGRSEGAVRNLCLRKRVPHRKAAGRLVFLHSELLDWIEQSPVVRRSDLEV